MTASHSGRPEGARSSLAETACPFGATATREQWTPCPATIPRAILLLAILVVITTSGCGYQQSGVYDRETAPGYQWHSLYREDVQTVAVPTFVNRSYHRGIEIELSKAVIQQMEAHTPYKVVSSQRADTILEGEVLWVKTGTLNINAKTALPQEQLLTMAVSFTWKNLRSGQIYVERRNFDQKATYFPVLGEGPFIGSQDAVERLSVAIVQELQADW